MKSCEFELRLLELQGMILTAITSSGGGCCPTAATEATLQQVSTEATLQQVLVALQTGQEFEQNLVIDQGGVGCPNNCPTYLQVRIWDTVTHTFSSPIYYNATGIVVVPVGPLALVNPQYVLDNILTQISSLNTSFVSVTRTPSLIRISSAGTIPAGARSVSVFNAGLANGTWLGSIIKPGEQFSYDAGAQGDLLTAFTYNGTGSELVITTLF